MTKQSLIPVGTERAIARRETNPFTFLQQEIDRLFEGFSRGFPAFSAPSTMPSMDVSETDKVIEITAEFGDRITGRITPEGQATLRQFEAERER